MDNVVYLQQYAPTVIRRNKREMIIWRTLSPVQPSLIVQTSIIRPIIQKPGVIYRVNRGTVVLPQQNYNYRDDRVSVKSYTTQCQVNKNKKSKSIPPKKSTNSARITNIESTNPSISDKKQRQTLYSVKSKGLVGNSYVVSTGKINREIEKEYYNQQQTISDERIIKINDDEYQILNKPSNDASPTKSYQHQLRDSVTGEQFQVYKEQFNQKLSDAENEREQFKRFLDRVILQKKLKQQK